MALYVCPSHIEGKLISFLGIFDQYLWSYRALTTLHEHA